MEEKEGTTYRREIKALQTELIKTYSRRSCPMGSSVAHDLQYRACRLWVQVWSMYTIPAIEWGPSPSNLLDEKAPQPMECRAGQLLYNLLAPKDD